MIVRPSVPKIKTLVSDVASVKQVNLSKTVIYLFRLYQIIFSVDLGFFEYKSLKTKSFCRSIAILQTCAICGLNIFSLFKSPDYNTAILYTIFMTQYFLNVCAMNFIRKGISLKHFLNTLLAIDTQLDFRCFNQTFVKMLVFIILPIAAKIFLVFAYCSGYPERCFASWFMELFYLIPDFSVDTLTIIYFFILYSVYLRLQKLTTILNKSSTNVISCHYLYKSIVENTLQVKSSFDIVFVTALIYYVPVLMVAIYNSLLEFQELGEAIVVGMSLDYLTLIQSAIIIFSIPLSASMLSFQTEKMRIILYDMLLEEKDNSRYRDIQRLINYLEARPFKLRACRVVPLDGSLPIIIINLCVTYLIVIIQFTHIY